MNAPLSAVVLCAGKGTRMKSDTAKVLHPLLGRPMAWYPIRLALELNARNVVAVVGHQADEVKATLTKLFEGQPLSFAVQQQQRGTGDAVNAARSALAHADGAVLILYGDVPLLTQATLQKLIDSFNQSKCSVAMISCRPASAAGYGRVVRDAAGKAIAIVEDKDATAEQKKIGEINAGLYIADAKFLWAALEKLEPKNAQGELYLTDIVSAAARSSGVTVVEADAAEVEGVNDKAELAARAAVLQERVNRRHMLAGVTLLHPASTFIDDAVEIGPDTVIGPFVTLGEGCEIGANVSIAQGCVIRRATVGDGTRVEPYSIIEDTEIDPRCVIGPFARCRPGTRLEEGVHLGNFVETKKAHLRKGTKANHLSYLGDTEIGAGCNIGAGTITCNYDGVNKHLTTLGDNVFIGSDTQLVAPVKVGDGAFIAAGSTITEDVPADALALSRAKQVTKDGWAEKRRKVLGAIKK
jgi:bifunctional UDP-N-acetylglucosamine pyrophosphorylase/glucosamine-1-phosphate N-acetyltransferase